MALRPPGPANVRYVWPVCLVRRRWANHSMGHVRIHNAHFGPRTLATFSQKGKKAVPVVFVFWLGFCDR